MAKPKSPSKASIKRAADRAERREIPELQPLPSNIQDSESAEPRPTGRPTLFKPEYIEQTRKLCEAGLTDFEIAHFFGINVLTLHRWKQQNITFCNIVKNAKDIADERVERSLYHRAIGYSFEAEEIFQYQGEIVRAKVVKHVPPETTAAIFWLKNRRREQWRDVQRFEFGRAGEFEKLSDEQLVAKLAKTAQLLLDHRPAEGQAEPESIENDEA